MTITAGTKCVFIALKKDNKYTSESMEWIPALPPLFGEYDDYGAIESVEDTIGARIVKQHFGIEAEEFVNMLERHAIGCDSQLDKPLPRIARKWGYMFVHRDVWDFMVTYTHGGWNMSANGSYDMGEPWLLEHIGFKHIGDVEDEKRFKHLWKMGDVEVKADGTWLEGSIFRLSDLEKRGISIPDDLRSLPKYRHWRLFDGKKSGEKDGGRFLPLGRNGLSLHGSMIGLGRDLMSATMWLNKPTYLLKKHGKSITEEQEKIRKELLKHRRKWAGQYSALERKYVKMLCNPMDNPEFVDSLCDYIAIHKCMSLYSRAFEPIRRYGTPQCGEHEAAQALFDKFAEVNKSMIYTEEDNDD